AELDSLNPVSAGISTDPAILLVTDPQLNLWVTEKENFESQRDTLELMGYGPGHQQVRRVTSQIVNLQRLIEERMQLLLADGDAPLPGNQRYDQLRQLEKQWFKRLNEIEAELETLGKKKSEVAEIEELIAAEQRTIDKARDSVNKMNIELDSVSNAVTIRGKGVNQSVPFNSGKSKQMAILGGMGGVFIAFGLVMGVGLLDSRLRNAADARMGLRETRMLGILPTLPENFADPEQSERAAHAVHHIRTLLQISNRGRG
ncbi:MAG: hypothetical protein AAGL98_16705, partial [Planctomycetota bacterium]